MASDQDIANGVASLLRQYDPNAVPSLSVNGVVQQLEAKLGLDLSDRAPFIRELILRFHQKDHFTLHHPPQFPNSQPNPLPHPHHPHHHHHHNPPPSIPSNPFPPPPLHHHELAFRCPPQQQQPQSQPSQPQQQQQQQPQPSQQQTQPSVSVAVAAAAAPAASVPESPKEREKEREMVSNQDIANGVASLLRQYDPNAVPSLSVNSVVQQLEAKLGLDLSDRAPFIRELILCFHQKDHFTLHHPPQFPNSHPNPRPHHHHNPPSIPSNPFPPPPLHLHELAFQCPPQQQPQPSQPQQQQQQPQPSQQQTQPSVAVSMAAAPAASVPESPKESTQSGGKRRGGPGGLNKVCGVSPQLQTIVGAPTMPRTEIVKQLWAYIRKNNLQDPSNKRKIICDDPLRLVFETDCTDMFKMNKLLAKHIIPLDPKGPDAKRLKATDVESAPQHTEPGPSPIVISDMLAKFFGTGEREMLQSEAVRRVWEYIKVNHLEFQDPMNMNGMIVRCDIKLQGLFGCESLPAMRISEMLMRHHFFRQS